MGGKELEKQKKKNEIETKNVPSSSVVRILQKCRSRVGEREKRESWGRERKNSSPILCSISRPDSSSFSPLPSLTWTVTWHRMSSFAVHVSICALLAVDLDNSKGGSGFGRFSKGHDVR